MRLVWELVVFLYRQFAIHPVRLIGRIIRFPAAYCQRIRFAVEIAWPTSSSGQSRLYRCQECGRLCHLNLTPGVYGVSDEGQIEGTCTRCRKNEQ